MGEEDEDKEECRGEVDGKSEMEVVEENGIWIRTGIGKVGQRRARR